MFDGMYMTTCASLVREKEASQDDLHRSESRLQDVTDKYVAAIDELSRQKEAEVMQV